MNQNDITINIRQLVLDGFSDIDRAQLLQAIKQQLQHRVSDQQPMLTNVHDTHLVSVPAGQFVVQESTAMDRLGGQIAGAIHDALSRVK